LNPRSDTNAAARPSSALKPWVAPVCHEEVFVQRYSWLRHWALRLSEGDPVEADDLLHNAFLQFVLRRRDLAEIENVEAYLYGLLRRLRLSHARKALRRRQEPLPVIAYDGAEICLEGADVHELLRVREELAAVCNYACLRKETSKAGSVLILRFFHGYYPKEIAGILRSSLRLANDWLRIARGEARTYLENPSRLRFFSPTGGTRRSRHADRRSDNGDNGSEPTGNGIPTIADVLEQLRARIREARSGACLSPPDVRRLYDDPTDDTVSSSVLSHLVSCPACLDLVSDHLGLESYSDRDPFDMLGPDDGWRTGEPARRASAPNGLLRVGAKRLRALVEHRPTELLIAANGLPLATLQVRSADSELELAANLDEPVDFIEIFSEQRVRLLLVEVEPSSHRRVEQSVRVDFDEGRWLGVRVEFTQAWPSVHLEYHDPFLAPGVEESRPSVEPLEAHGDLLRVPRPDWRAHLWRLWRLWRMWRTPILRPAFGIVTLVIALTLWATLPWHGRAASASELLRTTRASEQVLLATPNVVLHRLLLLEERRPPARTVLSRRRVEVWQNGARGLVVRRLYNESSRLTAGEWTGPDGSRTMYRPGAPPRALSRAVTAQLTDPEAIWGWEPSARHFTELAGAAASITVENRSDDYLLRYKNEAPEAAGVIEATLTIRKTEMRAVAQTLLVRADHEMREYAFMETAVANVQASSVPARTFELEPELLGRALPVDAPLPAVERSHAVPSRLSPDETNRLELDALFALHRLETCLVNPAALSRTADGGLHASGAARDEGCRARVIGRLAAFGRAPGLSVDIALAAAPAISSPIADRAALHQLPAYRALIDRFRQASGTSTEAVEAAVDDSARTFGAWALERSASALAHARELERLTNAWMPERLGTLDVDRMTMWLDVVRDHARHLRRESVELRQQLETLFGIDMAPSTAAAEWTVSEIRGADDVPAAVASLVALAASHDAAIRQLFDVTLQTPRIPVDTPALMRTLRIGEQQAAWFDEPWAIEPSMKSAPHSPSPVR
jgi:DNA-directed RNA polymerase specialized sigma24 family protein